MNDDIHTKLPALYARLASTSWAILTGRKPEEPAKELTVHEVQVAANQEWEHEGGSVRLPEKPGMNPVPKLPL
jgi:hypothetical protein